MKLIFVGPPGLGKTTTCRRLMGEIVDMKSANEAELAHPSTGIIESGQIAVRSTANTTAIVTQSEWSALASLQEESCMLFHTLVDKLNKEKNELPEMSDPNDINLHSDGTMAVDESTSSHLTTPRQIQARFPMQPASDSLGQPEMSDPNDINLHTDGTMAVDESTSSHLTTPRQIQARFPMQPASDSLGHSTSFQQDIPEVDAMVKEALKSPYWNATKHIKAFLRVEDAGGQPELLDMLPVLTTGPGLYLLFINLQNDLDHHYKLSHCNASGAITPPVESVYCVKDRLLSILSSIACSNNSTFPDASNTVKPSNSVSYIVGTHKDKVSMQHIRKMNKELFELIKSTNFLDSVEFFSEEELILTIDNMSGGAEEVMKVRTLLEKTISRRFKKLEVPAVWLIFSLILRKMNVRTATLEYCLQLSRELDMSAYETKTALWFLHHHAGVIKYFPNIPELKDLVIIDTQIVYDSVNMFVLRAMSFEQVGHKNAEDFKRTGVFMLSHISVSSRLEFKQGGRL